MVVFPAGVSKKKFFKDLYGEIEEDNVFNGAAALAYYLLFSLFPAMICLLTLLPYLPIDNLHQAVMDFIRQALPGQAAQTVEGVISEITQQKRGGLLSFGLLLALWSASSGLYAIMQQLNITYDVKESRPFWKARGTAIMLTLMFALLIIGSFALIIFGGVLQEWLGNTMGLATPILIFFSLFRWVVIALMLLSAFSLTYYFGPDVEQDFKFITPGAVAGVVVMAVASLAFRFYVENFGDYSASYGSLGAVIILMLWLYIAGLVILFGSEVNALIEHYSPEGKEKGEKEQPGVARGIPNDVPPSLREQARAKTPSSSPQPAYRVSATAAAPNSARPNPQSAKGGAILFAALALVLAATGSRENRDVVHR